MQEKSMETYITNPSWVGFVEFHSLTTSGHAIARSRRDARTRSQRYPCVPRRKTEDMKISWVFGYTSSTWGSCRVFLLFDYCIYYFFSREGRGEEANGEMLCLSSHCDFQNFETGIVDASTRHVKPVYIHSLKHINFFFVQLWSETITAE